MVQAIREIAWAQVETMQVSACKHAKAAQKVAGTLHTHTHLHISSIPTLLPVGALPGADTLQAMVSWHAQHAHQVSAVVMPLGHRYQLVGFWAACDLLAIDSCSLWKP